MRQSRTQRNAILAVCAGAVALLSGWILAQWPTETQPEFDTALAVNSVLDPAAVSIAEETPQVLDTKVSAKPTPNSKYGRRKGAVVTFGHFVSYSEVNSEVSAEDTSERYILVGERLYTFEGLPEGCDLLVREGILSRLQMRNANPNGVIECIMEPLPEGAEVLPEPWVQINERHAEDIRLYGKYGAGGHLTRKSGKWRPAEIRSEIGQENDQ